METFYRENTDIQEWVDLLIEKLFTVCLLSGSEADSEFYRGKQAAENISTILQNLTTLSQDALKDGIQQLIEQRLPDPRVVDNFPQFYSLMEEMIQSGLPIVKISEPEGQIPSLTISSEVASSKITLGRGRETIENSIKVYIPKFEESNNEVDAVVDVFAPSTSSKIEDLPAEIELYWGEQEQEKAEMEIEEDEVEIEIEGEVEIEEEEKEESYINESPNDGDDGDNAVAEITLALIEATPSIPVEGEQLSRVLKQIYPEEQPLWNVEFNQVPIFAQISNLAFILTEDNSIDTEGSVNDLESKGLSVIMCHRDDLAYPRRIERFIRNTLRKTISPKTSSLFLS